MLNRDFKRVYSVVKRQPCSLFDRGGYAVAFHGHPRYTKDIGVWIEMTQKNSDYKGEAIWG